MHPASETAPLKILLAEDSLVNQKLALALLKPQGHQIVVVPNGREAFEQRQSGKFDLILMDVQMPEMDGLEATLRIRHYERQKGKDHIPIIAMTAHAMKGDREECLAAGMDDYISKPVRINELYEAIERSTATASDRHAERQTSDSTRTEGDSSDVRTKSSDGAIRWQTAMEKSQVSQDELCELGQLFLEEAPRMLGEIRNALDRHDARSLRRAAHTLKSSAAVFEAQSAAETAKQMESLGKQEKLAEARDAFPHLEQEIDRVIAAVADHLDSTRTVGE